MSNMSYCRFQNTLIDLEECREGWEEDNDGEGLSEEEQEAKERLIRLCIEIAHEEE